MIRIENLTVRYGELTAVRNVSLQVAEGSVFGLIGPNGAGKTSMIRALVGLLSPDAGECLINGLRVADDPTAVRRLLGYMPDFFGVYDHLRVWEYLEFFGQLYGLRASRLSERIGEVVELTDLTFKQEALVGGLSRGMKQRLCLARALVHDPPILLLDEPASGVDPGGRYQLRRLLQQLGAAGKTILVSSHILPELSDICDSVGILEQGTLLAAGPVAEVTGQLGNFRALRLRVLDGRAAEAPNLLAGLEAVQSVEVVDAEVEIKLPDEDELVAAVLTALISAGLRLGSVREQRTDLEQLYLKLTHGELA